MALAPAIPTGFSVQQANSQVYLSWDLIAGATQYPIERSTDGVTFSALGTASTNSYTDSTVTVGTQYWYKVASSDGTDTSSYTTAQSVVPVKTGEMSLGQIRLAAQQRADRVNSNFVTQSEWNSYINQSYFELYDLLIDAYEDYYVADPYVVTTTGDSQMYDLPPDFYKLMGVDLGLAGGSNGYVTVQQFNFIGRNRYVYPQLTSSYLGVFNLRYRLVGDKLMFIPEPSGGQYIRIWYIPRLNEVVQDQDILDGISGWTEYIIVDAAIKALQKEESDVSVLLIQKQALIKRIEETAVNRDAGQPNTISDIRSFGQRWGDWFGGPNGDGPFGGY